MHWGYYWWSLSRVKVAVQTRNSCQVQNNKFHWISCTPLQKYLLWCRFWYTFISGHFLKQVYQTKLQNLYLISLFCWSSIIAINPSLPGMWFSLPQPWVKPSLIPRACMPFNKHFYKQLSGNFRKHTTIGMLSDQMIQSIIYPNSLLLSWDRCGTERTMNGYIAVWCSAGRSCYMLVLHLS